MAQIVHLTHNAGDWSEYDSGADGDRIFISANAGLNGTAEGIEIDQTGSAGGGGAFEVHAGGSPATIWRLGFRFDLNTLSISSGGELGRIIFLDGVSGSWSGILLKNSGSGVFISAEVDADAGSPTYVVDTGPFGSGEFTYELVIEKASTAIANDGKLTSFVNSIQANQTTGLDIFTGFEDMRDLHADEGVGSGSLSGICYLDEIIFRDDSTPIFFSGYDLVLGGGQQ